MNGDVVHHVTCAKFHDNILAFSTAVVEITFPGLLTPQEEKAARDAT